MASVPKKVYVMPKPTKAIDKVSSKMKKAVNKYSRIKKEWIKDKNCVVFPSLKADQIHHSKGRVGYADEWAKNEDIPLLIDIRHWVPVSMAGHIKIEENRRWAEEMGFTKSRLEILK